MSSSLEGRIAVFDGDSICAGSPRRGIYPWADRIGRENRMVYQNYAVGGGTITAQQYCADGRPRHWISRSIHHIYAQHPVLDYLVLEGGTNDADLLKNTPEAFGTLNENDYGGVYDETTFTGALESLFFHAIRYYPTAKIAYIVAQKMGPSHTFGASYCRRRFFLRGMEVCKKWGIPYLDLWEQCPLNPSLPVYYDPALTLEENLAAGKCYLDGQHLSARGYDLITPRIASFLESL